jgi:ATP-dependent RNA helicase DeaD
VETVNDRRITRFKDRITTALAASDLAMFRSVIEQYESEHDVPAIEIAAALARLAQGDKPLLLDAKAKPERREFDPTASRERKEFATREERGRDARPPRSERPERAERSERPRADRCRIPAQRAPKPSAIRPKMDASAAWKPASRVRMPMPHLSIARRKRMERSASKSATCTGCRANVGAIANEANSTASTLAVSPSTDHSLVLPVGMPSETRSC